MWNIKVFNFDKMQRIYSIVAYIFNVVSTKFCYNPGSWRFSSVFPKTSSSYLGLGSMGVIGIFRCME